jgi:hypothetical protein
MTVIYNSQQVDSADRAGDGAKPDGLSLQARLAQIKGVLIDIDGTLVNSQKELTQHTHDQVRRLIKQDYKVGVCTGRTYPEIKNYILPMFAADSLHVVDDGGLLVTKQGKRVAGQLLPGKLVQQICLQVQKLGADFGFAHHSVKYYNQRFLAQMQSKDKWRKAVANPTADNGQLQDWSTACLAVFNANAAVQDYLKKFSKQHPGQMQLSASKNPRYQTIYVKVAAGLSGDNPVNKGQAGQIWARKQGLQAKQVMIIGDSHNDLQAMQMLGVSVAMGNAVEEIKQVADVVIADVDQGGLGQFLQQL